MARLPNTARLMAAVMALLAALTAAAQTRQDDGKDDGLNTGQTSGRTAVAPVPIHLFWAKGCPHCADARAYLEPRIAADAHLELRLYEVSENAPNRTLFLAALARFGETRPAVPAIMVGEEIFIGYGGPEFTGEPVLRAARGCRIHDCDDVVGALAAQRAAAAATPEKRPRAPENQPAAPDSQPAAPGIIELPVFGEIDVNDFSLPVLTIALAGADGFNPCAMWVLIFLIGLLHGMRDRFRKWLLGATFLAVSAGVYYAFMAAWLNLFLAVGALLWLRIAIGLVALGGGAWYLREVVVNRDGLCQVGDLEGRQRTMSRLRAAVGERGLWLALLGVSAIAIGVNLVELLCSAGLPAIYTQVLAMSDLPGWAYHGYLALYILVFLLDDLVVFATAMLTLEAANATAAYARWSHLIGGLLLLAIGAALILKPHWLSLSAPPSPG